MGTEKRTDEEIVQRVKEVMEQDFFGFKHEVLVPYLGYESARPFIKDDVTAEQWEETREGRTPPEAAAEYLPFALGKIEDARGISAQRSVLKLAEWAWLDGEDELAQQIDSPSNYGEYGKPAVRLYAEHYGLPLPGWMTEDPR